MIWNLIWIIIAIGVITCEIIFTNIPILIVMTLVMAGFVLTMNFMDLVLAIKMKKLYNTIETIDKTQVEVCNGKGEGCDTCCRGH